MKLVSIVRRQYTQWSTSLASLSGKSLWQELLQLIETDDQRIVPCAISRKANFILVFFLNEYVFLTNTLL